MHIRKADVKDIAQLIQLRLDFIEIEFGRQSLEGHTVLTERLSEYFKKSLSDGTLIAALAESGGKIVSTAFLAINDIPPAPPFANGKTGTILNVLTHPEYRRKGIATALLENLIEEAKYKGISSLRLSATEKGEKLYESLGFRKSDHPAMVLSL